MVNRQSNARRFIASLLTFGILLWLIACSSGDAQGPVPAAGQPETVASPAFQLDLYESAAVDGRITAKLNVYGADELYQLSCRIAYDPAVIRPVDSRRAALVDERATFFATLKPADYVPVAFTYHDGESIPAATGTLAEVEFELLNPAVDPGLHIITVAEYLIARDHDGRDLVIDTGVAQ